MSNPKRVAIFGTGGHGREVVCLLKDLGRYDEIAGLFEPDDIYKKRSLVGVDVLPQSAFDPTTQSAVVAIGDSAIRNKVACELSPDTEFEVLVHPTATLSKWVTLGAGTLVFAGCVFTCDIQVGVHCHFNLNATISHDAVFGDFCTVSPGVNVSGNCTFGNRVTLGANAATRQQIRVCDDVHVGAGGVVVKDIDRSGVYAGVPAKRIGDLG